MMTEGPLIDKAIVPNSHNSVSGRVDGKVKPVKTKLTSRYAIVALYLLFLGFTLATLKNKGVSVQLGELVRIITLGPAYLIALKVIISRFKLAQTILSKCKLYLIFVAYTGLSSFWSVVPTKVLLNSVHDIGYLLVGILLLILIIERGPIFFFRHLSFVSLGLIGVSIVVSIYFPRIGIHETTHRWQGVTGNPNTLGIFCVICVWSLLMLRNSSTGSKSKLLILLFLVVPFFALFGGGAVTSVSSLVLSVSLCLTVPFFIAISKGNFNTRIIKIMFALFFSLFFLMALYAFLPDIFNFDYVLSKLGRNRSLSGRTSIWETGWKLFTMKPWLGWSFDGLLTVMHTMHFDIAQFHNGYLDLVIRGGLVGFLIFFLIVLITFRELKKIRRYDPVLGWGMTAFPVCYLIHNIVEASIMRPTSLYWFVYLLVYLISCNAKLFLLNLQQRRKVGRSK